MVRILFRIRPVSIIAVVCFLTILTQTSLATPLEEQEAALNLIADFAERICYSISPEGQGSNLELSGKAKAELNGILKKLVNLGVEGAAKYQDTQYKGLLQKDLANAMRDSANCKLEVFRELKEKLIVQRSGSSRDPTELERARKAVLNPYDYGWKCKITIEEASGQQIAAGDLVFGKVSTEPKMSFARVRFHSRRTRRLAPEITFDSGAWSMGWFGKCLEGECMAFSDNSEPHAPVFLANKVVFDEEAGRIDISGSVLTKRSGKHSYLGTLSGVCQPNI